MKRSIMIIMLTTLLWACNNGSSTSNAPGDTHSENHAQNTELNLNNGQKWKADAATNENVVDLRTIAQNFSTEPHTDLSDYQILNSDLQKGLDKMIKDCKMQGPDHDALHVWLEPLMKNVNDLKKSADILAAEKTFQAVKERLDLYNQYFQ